MKSKSCKGSSLIEVLETFEKDISVSLSFAFGFSIMVDKLSSSKYLPHKLSIAQINLLANELTVASVAKTFLAKTISFLQLTECFDVGSEHKQTTEIKAAWKRKKVEYQLAITDIS